MMLGAAIWFVLLALANASSARGEPSAVGESTGSKRQSATQERAAEKVFFDSIDDNRDGHLDAEELKGFITDDVGGSHFDDEQEVSDGLNNMLARVDKSGGGTVSHRELDVHWSSIESALSVQDVVDWVTYGLQLPQYAEAFRNASITGFDFPAVIENNGQLLREDIGVKEKHIRRKIMQVIKMKILGIGSLPGKPPLVGQPHLQLCDAIELRWTPPTNKDVPVHQYVLQRKGGGPRDPAAANWQIVYVGLSLSFTDSPLLQKAQYSYRVHAWNLMGHSEWVALQSTLTPAEHKHCSLAAIPSTWSEIRQWLTYFYLFAYHGTEVLVAVIAGVAAFARANPHGYASRLVGQASRWFPTLLSPVREMTMYVASQISPRGEPNAGSSFLDGGKKAGLHGSPPRPQHGGEPDVERRTSGGQPAKLESLTQCAICNKSFKTFARRKHHCGRCTRVFCNKCGATPHLPFTPCQIPSRCMCAECGHSGGRDRSFSGEKHAQYHRSASEPVPASPPMEKRKKFGRPTQEPMSNSTYQSQRPSALQDVDGSAGADGDRPASPREMWQYAGQEVIRQNREHRERHREHRSRSTREKDQKSKCIVS
jgi:hypothetical protein